MQPLLRLWNSTIGKKIAMSVSGLLLVGFLVTHVVSNLTIFTDPAHLDAWGRFLRSTGPFLWLARGGLMVLAVIHVVAATQLTLLDRKARPEAYADAPGKGSRWLARLAPRRAISGSGSRACGGSARRTRRPRRRL